MGGTYNLMGDGSDSGAATSTPASPDGLAGSRGALAANPTATGTPTSAADFNAWMQSVLGVTQGIPTATPTNSGNPLVANPAEAAAPPGFQHVDLPVAEPVVGHLGAPAPVAPSVVEAPKEFAAPTSFAKPWDAMIGANGILSSKGQVGNDRNWNQNPEAVRQWLQAFADSGGDYRVQDQYYNLVSPGAGMKIYWPGDPARPKGV